MALRFRRRVKLFPGVHLNISRSGISTSIGVRGASLTFGKHGTYANTGLPGTGISWRGKVSNDSTPSQPIQGNPKTHHIHWWTVVLFFAAMIGAGVTKSNLVIGVFWCGWLGYWLFLAVRLVIRRNNRAEI
jgi:Protein of unknown function (DUF4236)